MASMLTGTLRHVMAPYGTMDAKVLVREKVTRVDPVRISRAVAKVWQLADPEVEPQDIRIPDWKIEVVADSEGPVVEVISAVVDGTELINQNPVKTFNHDRDQWMLEQWNAGKSHDWIKRNTPDKWPRVRAASSVLAAITRHVRRHPELYCRKGRKGRQGNAGK